MRLDQIALQLFTLRDYLDNPEKLPVSLKKVYDIGYRSVQLSGACSLPAKEMKKRMDDAGLACISTHHHSMKILDKPLEVAEYLHELGADSTAYPYPLDLKIDTSADIKKLAKRLNESGRILREEGITLTYHNRHIDFRKFDGQVMLDIIYNETNPDYLQAEIDTYWVQYGGGNPVVWCQKLKNRLPLIHLKDYGLNKNNEIETVEIGYGNLDWNQIIAAADEAGCRWFIIEQDTSSRDPFESIRMSLDYIRTHLIQ